MGDFCLSQTSSYVRDLILRSFRFVLSMSWIYMLTFFCFPFYLDVYWDFCNPWDLLDLPRDLIHNIYSATTAGNLPYFDLLYISKYNNCLFNAGQRL